MSQVSANVAAPRVVGGAIAAGSAGGGQAALVLQLGSGGSGIDAMFKTWLRNAIRDGGGSPEILNRKVVFA
jgi:hypothetical protein